LEGRYVISEFEIATGRPLGEHANKYVNHCGYLVRDQIPISCREWREKRGAPEISFVSDRDKELVWKAVTDVFTFDTNDEELKVRIYDWTMKKMAVLFQNWKKSLYNKYVKKNETPDFNLKQYVKLRAFWDDFVQYKTSEEGEERANRNKENASKKAYHHHMGSGGYKSAAPKWDRMEQEMLARGVTPETIAKNWSERSKHWFYGHGGSVDPDTGALVWGQEISRAAERLVRAREAVQSGEFRPNREKDELTYALENPEHGGRTRGYGAVPWLQSFQADQDTYRSRQRKKDEEAERIRRLEAFVLQSQEREKAREEWMQAEIQRQVQAALSQMTKGQGTSQPEVNVSPPGQLKSSCASTEVPTIQDDTKLHFPVDDVTEAFTTCELHVPDGNATKKVAIAVVNPIDRTRTPRIHNRPVPGGYASVSVDRVEKGCGNVPLDIEGGDGEKTLGEAEKTFICWRKRFIIIPQHRFVCDFTSYIIYYVLKFKKSLLTKLVIVFFAGTPPT
jgi:hypothetical protein